MPKPEPEDLSPYVGRRGSVKVLSLPLVFRVEVVDTRRVYGIAQFLVTPVAGTGTTWVYKDRVDLEEAKR